MKTFVYVSSWKHFGDQTGIGIYEFDPETGDMTFLKMGSDVSCNVTKYDSRRGLLYVSNETDKLPWTKVGGGGRILVYSVDPQNGDLTYVSEQDAFSVNPCQFSIDKTGKYLVLANHAGHLSVTKITKDTRGNFGTTLVYDDAPLVLFPLDGDGSILAPKDILILDGEGPLSTQQHSMLHTAEFSPDGNFFIVTDIGSDRVYSFAIDYEREQIIRKDVYYDIPGTTPRYCVFHPTLPYLYVNHEGGGQLSILKMSYDGQGRITPLERTLAVEEDFDKVITDEQQGLAIHPSGKFLYDTLRGPDEVVVFSINQSDGSLHRIQNMKVDGKWVRACTVSPDGRYLVVMCMMSGDINVFAINEDGTLTPAGKKNVQDSCSWATFVQV